jgi:hypothetical protein
VPKTEKEKAVCVRTSELKNGNSCKNRIWLDGEHKALFTLAYTPRLLHAGTDLKYLQAFRVMLTPCDTPT